MNVLGAACIRKYYGLPFSANYVSQRLRSEVSFAGWRRDVRSINNVERGLHSYEHPANSRQCSPTRVIDFQSLSISTACTVLERNLAYFRHFHKSTKNSVPTDIKVVSGEDAGYGWDESCRYVKVGGHGNVRLDVYTLRAGGSDEKGVQAGMHRDQPGHDTSFNTHIYLPRGQFPTHGTTEEEDFDSLLHGLMSEHALNSDNTTAYPRVIKINYHLGSAAEVDGKKEDARFPIAIHEVQCCLDHILQVQDHEVVAHKPITISGSYIGASLALMLALTNPNEIRAVTALNPITDWTALDEVVQTESFTSNEEDGNVQSTSDYLVTDNITRPSKKAVAARDARNQTRFATSQQQAAAQLIDLRTKLFHSPSGFFDPFASPLLFLRAPGKDTPLWKTAKPEWNYSATLNHSMAFGPYDDELHTAEHRLLDDDISKGLKNMRGPDMITEAIGTDAFLQGNLVTDATSLQNGEALRMASEPSGTPMSSLDGVSPPRTVKRRKVIRRWPPIGRPEDVDLPFIRILATPPELAAGIDIDDDHHNVADFATILYPQAKEMVNVMRRACFWGREKSFAEEMVVFEDFSPNTGQKTQVQLAGD